VNRDFASEFSGTHSKFAIFGPILSDARSHPGEKHSYSRRRPVVGASNLKLPRVARMTRSNGPEPHRDSSFLSIRKQFWGDSPEDQRSLFFRNDQQQYRKVCTPPRLPRRHNAGG